MEGLRQINNEFNSIIEELLEYSISTVEYIPREYRTIEWMRDNIFSIGGHEDWMDEDWYENCIKYEWGTTSASILSEIDQRKLVEKRQLKQEPDISDIDRQARVKKFMDFMKELAEEKIIEN